MSLNNIHLNPQMLADLYANSLVETGTTTVPESAGPKHLGNNKKNIIIIVSHGSVPFLPDEELTFLISILSACKLSLADIAIVNSFGTNIDQIQNIIESDGRSI